MNQRYVSTTPEQAGIDVTPQMIAEAESAFSAYFAGAVSFEFAITQAYIAMVQESRNEL